jgi:hypothetical protein
MTIITKPVHPELQTFRLFSYSDPIKEQYSGFHALGEWDGVRIVFRMFFDGQITWQILSNIRQPSVNAATLDQAIEDAKKAIPSYLKDLTEGRLSEKPTITMKTTYSYVSLYSEIELPEGKTWADVKRHYIKWRQIWLEFKDGSSLEIDGGNEFGQEDWKHPDSYIIYEGDDENDGYLDGYTE